MRRPAIIFILLILLGGGGYLAYHILFPAYTSRFRLTIEVETPDGLKTGSSVIQTRFWASGCWLPEACGLRTEAHGEAVFVDLGHGKNLVAILGWGPTGVDQEKLYELTRVALAPGRNVNWKDEHELKGKGDLPPAYVPTFVTFSDLNDPKTARVVRPDQFEQVFGPGVRFKRAWIETTNDPITRKIEQILPWLRSQKGYLAGPRPDLTGTRPSGNLTGNEFIKGL
jgi:hypothetical protein